MTWRIWDIDGDGIKTFGEFFSVISQIIFLGLAVFVVITEGVTNVERFNTIKFVSVISASMGAAVFMEFLRTTNKVKTVKEDGIITTEGEK